MKKDERRARLAQCREQIEEMRKQIKDLDDETLLMDAMHEVYVLLTEAIETEASAQIGFLETR